MRISGFSFVRNAVKFDYPFLESIQSILPLCDEYVIAVGNSEDDTRDLILSLNSPKIRIIDTVWDDNLRTGGAILAQQTNIALREITGDWGFYLQADEIVHEKDFPLIREAMERHLDNHQVEGLLFKYLHFAGSYGFVGHSRRWYRREIRIIRNNIGVQSWGDAQGFRRDGKKLRVKLIDAAIYHYGWVKPPEKQRLKQQSFHRLWHSDEWVKKHINDTSSYNYTQSGRLMPFKGSHPAVMEKRISNQFWNFVYEPHFKSAEGGKERILDWFEDKTGLRIGEYRNYTII